MGFYKVNCKVFFCHLPQQKRSSQFRLSLQDGHFDLPDRMFHGVKDAWLSASETNMADVKELIPEFFYLPEFLVNENRFDLGWCFCFEMWNYLLIGLISRIIALTVSLLERGVFKMIRLMKMIFFPTTCRPEAEWGGIRGRCTTAMGKRGYSRIYSSTSKGAWVWLRQQSSSSLDWSDIWIQTAWWRCQRRCECISSLVLRW